MPVLADVDLDTIAPLGHPRDLLDGDGALVRRVNLSALEAASMGPDGADAIAGLLSDDEMGTLVLVDDTTESHNPVIIRYRSQVIGGLAAETVANGVEVALYGGRA